MHVDSTHEWKGGYQIALNLPADIASDEQETRRIMAEFEAWLDTVEGQAVWLRRKPRPQINGS